MQDPNWYTNFDFIDVWDIDSNSGIPYPQLKRNPQVRLKEMKIKHNPVKVEYNQGDQISLQGGDVELQYENGKTALVSMDETMLGHYDMMKIGKQTIEVKRLNKTASFTINVNPIPVKQITLDKTQLVLKKGGTATLTATISPENATNKDVEWSSQNSSIARIDQNGKITAVSPGNTVIEAKSESTGTVIATCNLSVIVTCDSLSITNKTVWDDDAGEYCITLNHGNTLQLKCDVSPSDATEGIIWLSLTRRAVLPRLDRERRKLLPGVNQVKGIRYIFMCLGRYQHRHLRLLYRTGKRQNQIQHMMIHPTHTMPNKAKNRYAREIHVLKNLKA